MKLEDYKEKNKLNYTRLANKLEISRNMAWRICNGKARCITLSVAAKIEKNTNGLVSMTDLIDSIGDC